jgi:hypothetical protein
MEIDERYKCIDKFVKMLEYYAGNSPKTRAGLDEPSQVF